MSPTEDGLTTWGLGASVEGFQTEDEVLSEVRLTEAFIHYSSTTSVIEQIEVLFRAGVSIGQVDAELITTGEERHLWWTSRSRTVAKDLQVRWWTSEPPCRQSSGVHYAAIDYELALDTAQVLHCCMLYPTDKHTALCV